MTAIRISFDLSTDRGPLRKLLQGEVQLDQQSGIELVRSEEFREFHAFVVHVLLELEERREVQRSRKKGEHYWNLSDMLLWGVVMDIFLDWREQLWEFCEAEEEEDEEVQKDLLAQLHEQLCLLAFLLEACRTRISWGAVTPQERPLLLRAFRYLPREGVRRGKRTGAKILRGSLPLPLRFLLLLHRQKGIAPLWFRSLASHLNDKTTTH